MATGKFIMYIQSANIVACQHTNDLSGCGDGGSISPITNVMATKEAHGCNL